MALKFIGKKKGAQPKPVDDEDDEDLDDDLEAEDEDEDEDEDDDEDVPVKKGGKVAAHEEPEDEDEDEDEDQPTKKSVKSQPEDGDDDEDDEEEPKKSKAKAAEPPSWLLRGKKAQLQLRRAQQEAETRRMKASEGRRFWLKDGEEATITFVDGKLDEQGMLDIPMFYEHRVNAGGRWDNFVCVNAEEPCPLCEAGDQPRFVGVCTVIDHRKIKSRDGTKVYKDEPKLFVLTPQTMTMLQKLAKKRGGLACWKVDVMRTEQRKPQVGDSFQFLERLSPKLIAAKYGKDGRLPVIDYAKAITYVSAAEMRQLGLGGAKGKVIGGKKGKVEEVDDDDLDADVDE